MPKNNDANYKSERDIEVARIAYIGAAIATVADAIAVIGDGISTYASKLALEALIEDYEESLATSSSSSSTSTEATSTPSSTSSSQTLKSTISNANLSSSTASNADGHRYKGKLKRDNFHSTNKKNRKPLLSNRELDDLKSQIDHYINELIDIRNSINDK